MRKTCAILLLAAVVVAGGVESRLPSAAKSGDRTAMLELLRQKADPNSTEPDGTTALHWAAYHEDAAMAKALLDGGAKVDAANRYGVTPLSVACKNGNAELVAALVKAGANVNLALPGGETPLMTASRTGKIDAVRVLLAHGANVQAQESQTGQTALIWAAAEGNAEVIEALLAAGADLNQRLDSGFTPFLFAVREGHIPAVKVLLKAGANVNDAIPMAGRKRIERKNPPRLGTTALMFAVANAHFDLAALLLDAGADANAKGPGYAALHIVTDVRKPGGGDNDPPPQGFGSMTSLEFVKKIAASGADLNSRMTKKIAFGMTGLNTMGATPFLLAAKTGDAELMRLLAKLGADPKIPNADGATPQMFRGAIENILGDNMVAGFGDPQERRTDGRHPRTKDFRRHHLAVITGCTLLTDQVVAFQRRHLLRQGAPTGVATAAVHVTVGLTGMKFVNRRRIIKGKGRSLVNRCNVCSALIMQFAGVDRFGRQVAGCGRCGHNWVLFLV